MAVLELESPDVQELDYAKIRERREALHLTQTEIAEKAGMSLQRWNDVETGRKPNVSIKTLATVATALGVDARELLTPKPRKGK